MNGAAAMPLTSIHRRWVSPMMRRILLVNVVPLALLVATLLYLNQFQNSLLEAEVSALREQARIYAGALGQAAVTASHRPRHAHPALGPIGEGPGAAAAGGAVDLSANLARPLLLRLTEPSPSAQARLFAPDGQQIADSRPDSQTGPGGLVDAPLLGMRGGLERLYDRLLLVLPHRTLATVAANADPNA